jgi:hypothetical protein
MSDLKKKQTYEQKKDEFGNVVEEKAEVELKKIKGIFLSYINRVFLPSG